MKDIHILEQLERITNEAIHQYYEETNLAVHYHQKQTINRITGLLELPTSEPLFDKLRVLDKEFQEILTVIDRVKQYTILGDFSTALQELTELEHKFN